MSVVYANGQAEVLVPTGSKLTLRSDSDAKIYKYIRSSNIPSAWALFASVPADSIYLSAAVSVATTFRIEASGSSVSYAVGVAPILYEDETAIVQAEIAALVDSAPGALDTLNELAAALGDDASYATTITNALALKAPLDSPAFTGNPTASTQALTDASTKLATDAFVDGHIPWVVATGMDPTGATDSTAALTTAMNSLPTGGGIVYIPRATALANTIYAVNMVVNKNGVIFKSFGRSKVTSPLAYIKPYDVSKPVFKFSDDTAVFTGMGLEDACIYSPTGTGTRGIQFTGGAQRSYIKNVQIIGFLTSCLEFSNEDVNPCQYNTASDVTIFSNGVGVYGIYFLDKHVAGGGWTTANSVVNFNVDCSAAGYPIVADSANTNVIANGYVQVAYSGLGLLFLKNYAGYTPRIDFANVNVDSVSGNNDIRTVLDTGVSISYSDWSNSTPIMGNIGNAGNMFVVDGHTTGSITTGTATLTVASTTGIIPGKSVIVQGAGSSGKPLVADVVSLSGSVVTLSANAGTTVTDNDVARGDTVEGIPSKGVRQNFANSPGITFGAAPVTNAKLFHQTAIYGSNASGSFAPFNASGIIETIGTKTHDTFGSISPATVSTITQSTTVVTVTTSGSHGCNVNDLVVLGGVNEPGVNGTYLVATVTSATVFTVTSGTSQTLAAVTGSPTMLCYKKTSISGGQLILSDKGLYLTNVSGAANPVLSTRDSYSSAATTLRTADQTNGFFFQTWGSSLTTGKGARFGTAAADKAYLTGNGAFWHIAAAAPATDAAGAFVFALTADATSSKINVKDSAGNTGAVLHSGNSTVSVTSAAPTGTVSTSSVMMGLGATAAITPKTSTRLLIIVSFQSANSTVNDGVTCDLRYGTGAAPSNGAAVTGTLVGIEQTHTSLTAAEKNGMTLQGIVTGLTVGTAYWIDVSVKAVTAGTASITGVTVTAYEM